jgi:hypothetical protein
MRDEVPAPSLSRIIAKNINGRGGPSPLESTQYLGDNCSYTHLQQLSTWHTPMAQSVSFHCLLSGCVLVSFVVIPTAVWFHPLTSSSEWSTPGVKDRNVTTENRKLNFSYVTRSRKMTFLGSRAWQVSKAGDFPPSVSRLSRECRILNILQQYKQASNAC